MEMFVLSSRDVKITVLLFTEEGRLRRSCDNVGCVGKGLLRGGVMSLTLLHCHANKLNKVTKLNDKLNRVFFKAENQTILDFSKVKSNRLAQFVSVRPSVRGFPNSILRCSFKFCFQNFSFPNSFT